jgi:hypothetical protein
VLLANVVCRAVPPLASVFTEPLEVAGIVLATSGLWGGAAGAWSWLNGGTGPDIADAAASGAAVGFIVGLYLGLAAALYLVLT